MINTKNTHNLLRASRHKFKTRHCLLIYIRSTILHLTCARIIAQLQAYDTLRCSTPSPSCLFTSLRAYIAPHINIYILFEKQTATKHAVESRHKVKAPFATYYIKSTLTWHS